MLKIFLMTKNEEFMIEDWIKYHGLLLGFENLHIIDGSDNQSVLAIYKTYLNKGLNVHRTDANFNEMSDVLNECMHKYKGTDNFLIKLDTDEFLAYLEPFNSKCSKVEELIRRRCLARNNPITSRLTRKYVDFFYGKKKLLNQEINNKLKTLPLTGQKYKASFTAYSVPASDENVHRPCTDVLSFTRLQYTHIKSFFHSSSFVSIDLGGHEGQTVNNTGHISTGLVIIHFQNTSTEDTLRRTKQALVSHGYIDERDSMEECQKKLQELKSLGTKISFHKIDIYLNYVTCILNKKHFSPLKLNEFNPHIQPLYQVREITLVKETLDKIQVECV